MPRPTKQGAKIIAIRNEKIRNEAKKGYPREYLCEFYSIDKSTLSRIINNKLSHSAIAHRQKKGH